MSNDKINYSPSDDLEQDDQFEDEGFKELDLNKINREEGHIYESIQKEIDIDELVRDWSRAEDFDPTDELFDNDSLGG